MSATRDRSVAFPSHETTIDWPSFVLRLTLLALAATSLFRFSFAERWSVLMPMIVAGGAIGLGLARTPLLDLPAHLTAFAVALILAASIALGPRHDLVSDPVGEIERRINRVAVLVESLVSWDAVPAETRLFVIGSALFLIGYLSLWLSYRWMWTAASLVAPAALFVVGLATDLFQARNEAFGFLTVAAMLVARGAVVRRIHDWRRSRLFDPPGLTVRSMTAACALVALAIGFGAASPRTPLTRELPAFSGIAQHARSHAKAFGNRARSMFAFESAFGIGEEFPGELPIGGELRLTDTPVARLDAPEAAYLVVRRYDYYTGRSWTSGAVDVSGMESVVLENGGPPLDLEPDASLYAGAGRPASSRLVTGTVTDLIGGTRLVASVGAFESVRMVSRVYIAWLSDELTQSELISADASSRLAAIAELSRLLEHDAHGTTESLSAARERRAAIERELERLRAQGVSIAITVVDGHSVLGVDGPLPLVDQVTRIEARDVIAPATSYDVAGLVSIATDEQLRSADQTMPALVEPLLTLPEGLPPRVAELAREIVTQSGAVTNFDQAIAIQNHLRANYRYDEHGRSGSTGADAVDEFLFIKQSGRCDHFASAMAVMLRTLGIPTRLATGYYPGASADGVTTYLDRQWHAWVEVYFPDYGWIPFEPTPAESTPPLRDGAFVGQADLPSDSALDAEASPVAGWTPPTSDAPAVGPIDSPDQPTTDGGRPWSWAFAGVAALLFATSLFALVALLQWRRGLRGLSPAAALYASVLRLGLLFGVGHRPTMTPGEFASGFVARVPGSDRPVRLVTDLYAAERFGRHEVDATALDQVRKAWHEVKGLVWRQIVARLTRRAKPPGG